MLTLSRKNSNRNINLGSLMDETWSVLNMLPYNQAIKAKVDALSCDASYQSFNKIFHVASFPRLLYVLQYAHTLMEEPAWKNRFSTRKGHVHLKDVYLKLSEEDFTRLNIQCFGYIATMLSYFTDYNHQEIFNRTVSYVSWALNASNSHEFIASAFQLLFHVLAINKSVEVPPTIHDTYNFNAPEHNVREVIAQLQTLIKNTPHLADQVATHLSNRPVPDANHAHYFSFWHFLNSYPLTSLNQHIFHKIYLWAIYNDSHQSYDLLSKVHYPHPAEDTKKLLKDKLFYIPTDSQPLNLKPALRKSIFNFLTTLNLQDQLLVFHYVHQLLHFAHWRQDTQFDWNINPSKLENTKTTYVGLLNLGCTCYFNSIIQILYFTESFSEPIL